MMADVVPHQFVFVFVLLAMALRASMRHHLCHCQPGPHLLSCSRVELNVAGYRQYGYLLKATILRRYLQVEETVSSRDGLSKS